STLSIKYAEILQEQTGGTVLRQILSALIVVTLASCAMQLPLHTEFVPGMSKTEVLQKFGEPDSTDLMQTNLRVDRYGEVPLPEPEYTEIWRYKSRHNYDPASAVRIDGETLLSFSPNEIGRASRRERKEQKLRTDRLNARQC